MNKYIYFLYDESGTPYSFIYGFVNSGNVYTTQYYYVKNLQNDVIAIVDEYGNMAAEYIYDAWGNVLYTNEYTHDNIGYVNPIRYRSYYQDNETGFYYLQTRYYDPAIRRFINADGYVNANGDILGYNMYAYCGNNPVMYKDETGNSIIGTIFVVVSAIVAVAATVNDIYQLNRSDEDEKVYAYKNGDTVEVKNSYKILTPWVRDIYSIYVNHFNDDTKDIIKGSTVGVRTEWDLHNIAYFGGAIINSDSIMDPARHVAVGATIFSDKHGSWDIGEPRQLILKLASTGMKAYHIIRNPREASFDVFVELIGFIGGIIND